MSHDISSIEGEGPVKIAEYTVSCPYCGAETFKVEEYTYVIPVFGRIILSVGSCSTCGFVRRDVGVLEGLGPKKVVVRVRGERELRYLMVKSARTAIRIPEVGLEYTPTMYSYGYITTVEGILYEFQQAALIACSGDSSSKCQEILSWIDKAINGETEFTLILCDEDGLSKVVGESVEEKEFDEECYH